MRSLVATIFAISSINVYTLFFQDPIIKKLGENPLEESALVISNENKFKEPSIMRMLRNGIFNVADDKPNRKSAERNPIEFERDTDGKRKAQAFERNPIEFERDTDVKRKAQLVERNPIEFEHDTDVKRKAQLVERNPDEFERDTDGKRKAQPVERNPIEFERDTDGKRKAQLVERNPIEFERDTDGKRKAQPVERNPDEFERDTDGKRKAQHVERNPIEVEVDTGGKRKGQPVERNPIEVEVDTDGKRKGQPIERNPIQIDIDTYGKLKGQLVERNPIQIEIDASFPLDLIGEDSFETIREYKQLLPSRKLHRMKNPFQEKRDIDMRTYMMTVDQKIMSIERQNGFLRNSIDETIRCLDNMQKAIGVFLLWQIVVFFLILLIMIGRILYMRRKGQFLQNSKEGADIQYE